MKKIGLILLSFGLTQAIFCQQSTSKKLDQLVSAYGKVNKFNGTVLVAQKGKIFIEKGYGIKNDRLKTSHDANSIFQIYSVTKTFTATLILKLVELNKLALTDRLSRFYPNFPKADSITIEQLLTHTAGIYEYTRGHNMVDMTEKSFVDFLITKPLDFSPGTGWSYSNSGYWLLGFIIQKVTGISYEKAVQQYIFNPLQMTQSGFGYKELSHKNKTMGYEQFNEKVKKEAIVYDTPGPYAAGAIYSTVGDLYKYHRGLQTFKIVTKKTLEKAYTAVKNNYGYGWIIDSLDGKKMVSHSGGGAGYLSNFVRIPQEDICIILLNNTESADLASITKKITNVLFKKPYVLPSEIKLSEEILEAYVGAYAIDPDFCMYISVENGRLVAQGKGQGKTIVLAQKENYFLSEETGAYLEFTKDSSGQYNQLIIHQGRHKISAKRFNPTWGLIGSATTKGWDEKLPDLELIEDPQKKGWWVLSSVTLQTGEFKFRFNNDWSMNYGDNGNDGILEEFGMNIKVVADIYDIILDLTDKSKPTYHINKKNVTNPYK